MSWSIMLCPNQELLISEANYSVANIGKGITFEIKYVLLGNVVQGSKVLLRRDRMAWIVPASTQGPCTHRGTIGNSLRKSFPGAPKTRFLPDSSDD
jgi:hypothetical protein